jgi:beta-amylase
VNISGKISGIHWWYNHESHAAELTAGYYHTFERNGYDEVFLFLKKKISKLFKKYDTKFQFTCLELKDSQLNGCDCSPEKLVQYTRETAWRNNIRYSGENALPYFNS